MPQQNQEIPDFNSSKSRAGKRGMRYRIHLMIVLQLISLQATYAFASSEILTQERIFSLSETPLKKTITHDAIHNMEAFFWVMTYICITQQGPGGDRRDNLKPEGNTPKQLLLTNYYCTISINSSVPCHGPSDFGEISRPSHITVANGRIHLANRPNN